ncbi:TIGR02281 family clan AA aspartic protease [Ectothiorhodospiraceae bacterium 2226]|nr:TIGR02281 family clan AA aspartic protease [Ectothiorhodospiraceae bacterium 2226]
MSQLPSALGKIMMVAGIVIALGLLTVYFDGMLERQYNPNQQVESLQYADGMREVVLQRNRSGHYVVTGQLNGRPVDLLVDTGATVVSIPEPLARELGLRRGHAVPTQTASGMVTTYATVLERVQIGDIEVRNVRASINPHSDLVLLGMSFLRELELTQRGDTLTLRQH